jgi:hypothetical protein
MVVESVGSWVQRTETTACRIRSRYSAQWAPSSFKNWPRRDSSLKRYIVVGCCGSWGHVGVGAGYPGMGTSGLLPPRQLGMTGPRGGYLGWGHCLHRGWAWGRRRGRGRWGACHGRRWLCRVGVCHGPEAGDLRPMWRQVSQGLQGDLTYHTLLFMGKIRRYDEEDEGLYQSSG